MPFGREMGFLKGNVGEADAEWQMKELFPSLSRGASWPLPREAPQESGMGWNYEGFFSEAWMEALGGGSVLGFSTSHGQMWELDYKEGWAQKNWCFQIVVLEKILESPLDCKEMKPVNPKGNRSWIVIGRTDAEAECEKLTHWKRPWCWERLRAGGDGGDRGWDGWMASSTQWTCVWANAGRYCAAVHGVTKSGSQLSNSTKLSLIVW